MSPAIPFVLALAQQKIVPTSPLETRACKAARKENDAPRRNVLRGAA